MPSPLSEGPGKGDRPTLSPMDRKALDRLRRHGSNLSKPHPIDHYCDATFASLMRRAGGRMTWHMYSCQINNKPAVVLVDDRFADRAPVAELPSIAWFGVYCKQPLDGHIWNPKESDSLDVIEGDLIDLCGGFSHGWAAYLLRIATPGIREYYLYHSNAAELQKAFIALKATHPEYRIEFDESNDPSWIEYRKYVSFKPKGQG